jgi:hypothetical protein
MAFFRVYPAFPTIRGKSIRASKDKADRAEKGKVEQSKER